jgi:hypothetical protein
MQAHSISSSVSSSFNGVFLPLVVVIVRVPGLWDRLGVNNAVIVGSVQGERAILQGGVVPDVGVVDRPMLWRYAVREPDSMATKPSSICSYGLGGPYPIVDSFFARGFGVGTRHRGAAVVTQITTNTSYTPPVIPT